MYLRVLFMSNNISRYINNGKCALYFISAEQLLYTHYFIGDGKDRTLEYTNRAYLN